MNDLKKHGTIIDYDTALLYERFKEDNFKQRRNTGSGDHKTT